MRMHQGAGLLLAAVAALVALPAPTTAFLLPAAPKTTTPAVARVSPFCLQQQAPASRRVRPVVSAAAADDADYPSDTGAGDEAAASGSGSDARYALHWW